MAGGGLVVRAPNHLGDLVMALPALAMAGDADVQVVRGLAPLVRMAGLRGGVLPFDRGRRGFLEGVRSVRRGRYARGVLLPPSLGSALVLALGGVRARRGVAADGRALLLTERVARAEIDALHRVDAYCLLVGGRVPDRTPTPRLTPDAAAYAGWDEAWHAAAPPARGPMVGVFPGSNAPSRRWDVERFAAVARGLAERGATVAVFGGAAEREITREVAGDWAADLGGRTSLPALAAGLARCRALVTNDSGPQHVAAAVGTPVVALWGAGDPRATGPVGSHRLLRHPELPCVPCVKNVCPRAGAGYVLADARNECIRLTAPEDVLRAVEPLLV